MISENKNHPKDYEFYIIFYFYSHATLQSNVALYFFTLFKPKYMSESTMYVTKETFERMREELQKMKSVDRPAASRALPKQGKKEI